MAAAHLLHMCVCLFQCGCAFVVRLGAWLTHNYRALTHRHKVSRRIARQTNNCNSCTVRRTFQRIQSLSCRGVCVFVCVQLNQHVAFKFSMHRTCICKYIAGQQTDIRADECSQSCILFFAAYFEALTSYIQTSYIVLTNMYTYIIYSASC